MIPQEPVQEHYGVGDLTDRIALALKRAGLDGERLQWSDLADLDQFHVRGLAATAELAKGLHLETGATLLDVGCGLGGPARYLAATRGCHVTGIDLSHPFVAAARMLAERTCLADRTTFVQGDALDMPFPNNSFDAAWTQHVAMNIADRARFYASIHRVLKPGGKLAIYDVLTGNGDPLLFPVPWARQPEIHFLVVPDAMRATLHHAGFAEISWTDTTEAGLEALAQQQQALRAAPASGQLGLGVVMGSELGQMATNLAQNLKAGRVRLIQAIVQRD